MHNGHLVVTQKAPQAIREVRLLKEPFPTDLRVFLLRDTVFRRAELQHETPDTTKLQGSDVVKNCWSTDSTSSAISQKQYTSALSAICRRITYYWVVRSLDRKSVV